MKENSNNNKGLSFKENEKRIEKIKLYYSEEKELMDLEKEDLINNAPLEYRVDKKGKEYSVDGTIQYTMQTLKLIVGVVITFEV